MQAAPLSRAISVVAKAQGKDPVRDRAEIVDTINSTLSMLYRTESLMWLYFKENGCAQVDIFNEGCRNNCAGKSYPGVVIPAGIQNIRELRSDEYEYDITEERVATGCGNYATCNPKAEHLPPRLLAADIPACDDSRLVTFRSSAQEDCGKLVGLSYVDMAGGVQREDVVLSNGTPMSTSVSVAEFLEISFPERCGWLTVETADGAPLGRYHPSIMVPSHQAYRLQSGCRGQRIQWRGLREPHQLVFDTDMVPFSDTFLWSLALKAYEYRDTLEMTAAQTQGLARIYGQLSAVSNADLAATNTNFNARVIAGTAKSAMSAARLMSTYGTRRTSYR